MLAWKGKWIITHSERINSTTRGSSPVFPWAKFSCCLWVRIHYFCLSLNFHFHYLEKYLFPTASGNNTTVSASSWLWKQSLVTNCCVLHRDSLTEKLPTNRHFISAVIWCVTAAIPLLSCPQHSPFHWIAFCISIPSSEIKLCISQSSS